MQKRNDDKNKYCLLLVKYIYYISVSLMCSKMCQTPKSISFYALFFNFGKTNCDLDLTLLVVEKMDETVCGKEENKRRYLGGNW
jgi:hypothetical protein